MKQSISMMQSTILVLLTTSSLFVRFVVSDDPQAQAKPIFFQFATDDGADFQCPGNGNGCSYRGAQWPPGLETGQGSTITVGSPLFAWTSQLETDRLVLTRCRPTDGCFVECNAGCTCLLENEPTNPCPEVASLPPTSAPTVDTSTTCMLEKDTSLCAELMPAVPAGNDFDCYNFCGGGFTTFCDFDSTCNTPSACTDKGEDGTLMGTVFGCTNADRASETPPSAASGLTLGFFAVASIAALLVLV